ncbi:MAG: hypothetical protein IPG45_06815 [Deltaproteobacteria bacterium]|jgi:hypothetical protein|nr:hypothetical protein [Deltaproteobacteria bacterium]
MAITDTLKAGAKTADTFVKSQHGNLTSYLGKAASGTGILAKGAGLLGKVAGFLGPWGTAISVATLAWNVGSSLFGSKPHPAQQRV